VKPFRYFGDPLCILAAIAYAANRWWLREHVGGDFLRGYFNDLLLIPAALPLVLWVQRRIGVRGDDTRPRWGEIALHLVMWSVTAEWLMPHLTAHATGDWRDVIAYGIGGAVAGCWWQLTGGA
jgi:hypothetical protein